MEKIVKTLATIQHIQRYCIRQYKCATHDIHTQKRRSTVFS